MHISRWHRPRRSVVAVAAILLAVFAAIPSASAGGRGGHIEHFLLVASNPSANPTIVAFGPIHAKGVDKVISDSKDTFAFPNGTLTVVHFAKHDKESSDPKTCYFAYREWGTYKVTGGTGAYAHASGHGKYAVKAVQVGCNENKPPEVFYLEIKASGPLYK